MPNPILPGDQAPHTIKVVGAALLRNKAQRHLAQQPNATPRDEGSTLRILHELQVHQVELEMQNEELRRTQEELEEARQRYVELFDQAPVAHLTLDAFGIIVDANLAGAALLGLERHWLKGRAFALFVDPPSLAMFRQSCQQILATDTAGPCDLRLMRPNGTDFHARLALRSSRSDDGEQLLRVVVLDLSALQRTEDDLRIAATAFESNAGMLVTDAAQVILRTNQAFTQITGYTQAEVIGRTPGILKSGRHDQVFFDALWSGITATGAWQGEVWNRRKNGEVYPQWLSIAAVMDTQGQTTHYVGSFTDITQHKAAESEIRSLAFFDPLTRLPNRRMLAERLAAVLSGAARHARKGALLFVDLDNFKTINDTLGHDKGDLLLMQVAERLRLCTRDEDTVARIGGDEFVVLLESLSANPVEAANQASAVGTKILQALSERYDIQGTWCRSSGSIGITLIGDSVETVDEPLKRADLALYQAKNSGRNTLRFFEPQMQIAVTARAALEAALHEAVESQQFVLHYQPQLTVDGAVYGAEALVRWQDPARGLVLPEEFIALAEEGGLILPLGAWVLETACAQLTQWSHDRAMSRLTLSVNVSARQFHRADFVANVLAALERNGTNPAMLKLELTESLLVHDLEVVVGKMQALKSHGIGLVLDDFGTGYSSLAYLKRLPLEQMKIEQSFVRDIVANGSDVALAGMMINLAQSLQLDVVAEGVETREQLSRLTALGCKRFQGFLFSEPVALAQFNQFVQHH